MTQETATKHSISCPGLVGGECTGECPALPVGKIKLKPDDTKGYAIVCMDDGVLYGHGDTLQKAWNDAEEWIIDCLRDNVVDEIQHAVKSKGSVSIMADFKAYPCTMALRKSIDDRGGHDIHHVREDGSLDYGR